MTLENEKMCPLFLKNAAQFLPEIWPEITQNAECFFFFCSWQTLKLDSHLPKKFVLLA